ncbi:MAG: hypothetical protein OXR73_02255 [Myxococcales bacterium]|nr:hypothetical protein [Myxococcales bacterium]
MTSVQHGDGCAERYKYRGDGALVEAENGSPFDKRGDVGVVNDPG